MARELLVLVPALAPFAQGEQRQRFVDGMVRTSEDPLVQRSGEGDRSSAMAPLRVTHGDEGIDVDVREAHWNDLVPSLSTAGLRTRVVRGLSLTSYWVLSGVWRGFLGRMYLTLGLVAAMIALLVWYYGVVVLFLDALLADPTVGSWIQGIAGWLYDFLAFIGTWKVWAVASVVLGLIPVAALVDMLDFTKRYLVNERTPGGNVGLHVAIRDRVPNQVLDALAGAEYDRLVLVSHSFGTLVAVDVLADLPLPDNLRVRMVTLGSPTELLARRDPTLLEEIRKCRERPQLEAWIDVHADNDWFATGVPLPEDARCRSIRMPVKGAFVDAVSGRTHDRYFDQEQAVAAVVGR